MNSTSTRLPVPDDPGTGRRLAEQGPEESVAAPTEFLAPYREDGGGSR